MTPGQLFWPIFAELDGYSSDTVGQVLGRWAELDPPFSGELHWKPLGHRTGPDTYVPCGIARSDRMVWSDLRGVSVLETRYANGTVFNDFSAEGPVTNTPADKNWASKAGQQLFNQPLLASHQLGCIKQYVVTEKRAISILLKQGKRNGNVIAVPNLHKAAFAAFVKAVNLPAELGSEVQDLTCRVPTARGLQENNTTYICGDWTVTQRPFQAMKGGRVVLSDDTVDGVKFLFKDSVAAGTSKSNRSSSTRKAKIEQ